MGSMKILPSNGNPTGVLAIFSDNAGKLFLSAAINTVFLVIPIFAATAFSFLGSGVISNLYKTAENKAKGLVARNTVGRTAKWADGKLGNTKLGNMTWMRDLRSVTTGALGNKKFFGTKNLDEQKKDDATSARLQKGLSDKQSFENNLAFIKFSQAFRGPETGAQKKNRIEKEKRALFDTEQYLKKQKAEDIWNMKDQLINNPAVAKLISDEQMKGLAESDTATTDEGKATLEALKQSRTTGKAEQFSSTDIDVNNNTVNIYAANANHTSGEKKAIREEKEKREREASKITAETAKDMISTPAFKNIAIAMKPDKLKEVILDNPAISETDKEALRKAYEAHHIANPAEIERLSTTDAAKLGENVLTDDAVLKALSPQKTLDIASKLDDQPELQDEIMSKIKDKIKTQDIPLDEMVKIKSDNSDIKQEISNKIIANSNNPKKLAVFLASIIKLPKEQLENLPHKIFENKNVIAHLDRGTLMSVVEGKNTKQKVAIKSALKGIANDPNFANLSSYQMDTLSAVEDYLHSGPGKNL